LTTNTGKAAQRGLSPGWRRGPLTGDSPRDGVANRRQGWRQPRDNPRVQRSNRPSAPTSAQLERQPDDNSTTQGLRPQVRAAGLAPAAWQPL